MKEIDFYKQIKEILPCAYRIFKDEQVLPFSVYYLDESNDKYADNINFLKKGKYNLEVYSQIKNKKLETQIENLFLKNETTYKKTESFLEDEKMYEVLYEFEMEV